MKKIMIAFAWTVCVLTACDKNKPSQTEMQALPVDVAKPLVENVTLTKDYPGYHGSGIYCRFGGTSKWNFTIQEFCTWFPGTSGTGIVRYRTDTL